LYLSVALTTLATLLLELSLTRIFSVVFYYHFAFLAISIALFGLGAGGIFSYFVTSPGRRPFRNLGQLSAFNGILVVLGLAFLLGRRGPLDSIELALIYTTSALPFFVSGAIVSSAIAETTERVNLVYFFDLLGAAGGCLVLVPLLDVFGGPNTVLVAAVLFAVAGSLWHNLAGSVSGRIFCVSLGLALDRRQLVPQTTRRPIRKGPGPLRRRVHQVEQLLSSLDRQLRRRDEDDRDRRRRLYRYRQF
jgi:hypothetical protein